MKNCKTVLTLLGALCVLGFSGQIAHSQQKASPNTVQVHMVITDAALRDDAELPRLQKEDVKVKQGRNFLQVNQVIPAQGENAALQNQTPAMARFKKDQAAQKAFAHTVRLSDVKAEDFDTVFYPGGHGPMWDLAESPVSIALLESFYNSGKPIALVCHSPGVLRHVKYKGDPLVEGKHVTGFTNGEEEEVKLTHVVPFLVEDELLRLGAVFEKMANWQPFSITDGRLITGQNPASSTSAAQALLKLMAAQKAA